jgi:hypothetical protein
LRRSGKGYHHDHIRLCNLPYEDEREVTVPSRAACMSPMSWLTSPRASSYLFNSTRHSFSFSFRPRFPRDLSTPPHPRNGPLRSGGVPSFREQVARASPVPCFADAVRHPGIGKHIIVRQNTHFRLWSNGGVGMLMSFNRSTESPSIPPVRVWHFSARLCRRCS